MPTTITKTKSKSTTSSKIFTRITLDQTSLQAVKRVQSAIPNYDINDAVKMIFGLGINELDSIFPLKDENGFTATTKIKLLEAKEELEKGNGMDFNNKDDAIKYVQDLSK